MQPKYPQIRIHLSNRDGNAFSILGRISAAIKRKLPKEEQDLFFAEAKSGNYDHLLQTCMQWFDCH